MSVLPEHSFVGSNMAAGDTDYDALAQQIAQNAAKPQSTAFDGLQQTERPLGEQIEALRFLERRQAVNRSPFGQPIRINRGDALG